MALTRKMLAAMDIPAEKIDEIITAHTETLNAIKEERDGAKESVARLATVEQALASANAELKKYKEGDWESKYNTLKGEYETYKTTTETNAKRSAKETAYKQLLLDAGVSDKRVATILKVSNLDSMELGDDGKFKDADKLTESVKTEWADFIVTKREQGAEVSNPPGGDGSTPPEKSRVAQMVAEYRNAHYGNSAKED